MQHVALNIHHMYDTRSVQKLSAIHNHDQFLRSIVENGFKRVKPGDLGEEHPSLTLWAKGLQRTVANKVGETSLSKAAISKTDIWTK